MIAAIKHLMEKGLRPDQPLSAFGCTLYRTVHGIRMALVFVPIFTRVRLLEILEGARPPIALVMMGPISLMRLAQRK